MAFAGCTSNHQGPHPQEARPEAADEGGERPNLRARAGKKILIVYEERLNGANFAAAILQGEIAIFEPLIDRVRNDSVIAVILALLREGRLPAWTARNSDMRKKFNVPQGFCLLRSVALGRISLNIPAAFCQAWNDPGKTAR